jgi:16S rRNA processing protein RimM
MSAERRRVLLGEFAGAHGVKGDVKVRAFTARAADIAAYGTLTDESGGRRFTLQVLRVLKPGLALARVREIRTREEAEALTGAALYVDRSALPAAGEGEFYIADLVGVDAFDEAGARLGRVEAVVDFGAGPLLSIALGRRRSVYCPFTSAAAPVVDLARRRIVIARDALAESPQLRENPAPGARKRN